MKIYRLPGGIEYWYDRSTRCWYAAPYDAEGNQLEATVDAYTKEGILRVIKIFFCTLLTSCVDRV